MDEQYGTYIQLTAVMVSFLQADLLEKSSPKYQRQSQFKGRKLFFFQSVDLEQDSPEGLLFENVKF